MTPEREAGSRKELFFFSLEREKLLLLWKRAPGQSPGLPSAKVPEFFFDLLFCCRGEEPSSLGARRPIFTQARGPPLRARRDQPGSLRRPLARRLPRRRRVARRRRRQRPLRHLRRGPLRRDRLRGRRVRRAVRDSLRRPDGRDPVGAVDAPEARRRGDRERRQDRALCRLRLAAV